ncbi:MAG: DNA-3-methyladenine glycosylase I [bacterium]|nr:DNA-3-methyladenine glycosylase I [bacterium]
MIKHRCKWSSSDPLYIKYHDEEWGVPKHDDAKHFEMILLEGAQAGLSWITVLRKREGYRRAFDDFDVKKVAAYDSVKHEKLRENPHIIRNRLKIASATRNARVFIDIQKEFGSFDAYIWQFVGGKPIINAFKELSDIPASTKESDAMSKDLIKRGMNFVGTTICYAYMQSAGMVNDHEMNCFRYKEV